jgi:hypothetical protein
MQCLEESPEYGQDGTNDFGSQVHEENTSFSSMEFMINPP